jgi:hypothetical protein
MEEYSIVSSAPTLSACKKNFGDFILLLVFYTIGNFPNLSKITGLVF